MDQLLRVDGASFGRLVALDGLLHDGVLVARVDSMVAFDHACHVVDASSFTAGGSCIGIRDYLVVLARLIGQNVLVHEEINLLTRLKVHRNILLSTYASRLVKYLG